MALSVKLEMPRGNQIAQRTFWPGDVVYIVANGGALSTASQDVVTFQFYPEEQGLFSPRRVVTSPTLASNCTAWFTMPDVEGRANFMVTWDYWLFLVGTENLIIPIGLSGVDPGGPIDPPPTPTETITNLMKYISYAAIGLGGAMVLTSLIGRGKNEQK